MPSTVSATITMVANTGWLMETRVIHMGPALHPRREAVLQVVELGGDHVLGRLHARQDLDEMRALVARSGRHRPALQAMAGDQPDVGLHAVAAHRRDRQRRRL